MEFALPTRERFICQSACCGREIEILLEPSVGAERASNPRCACGAETKRVYSKPVLQKISKAEAMVRFGFSVPAKTWAQKC
jgi:hypothetical protein